MQVSLFYRMVPMPPLTLQDILLVLNSFTSWSWSCTTQLNTCTCRMMFVLVCWKRLQLYSYEIAFCLNRIKVLNSVELIIDKYMTRVARSGLRGSRDMHFDSNLTRDRIRMPQLLETESILSDIKLPLFLSSCPLSLHITLLWNGASFLTSCDITLTVANQRYIVT